MFLEKYDFNDDKETYSDYFYNVGSDEEYSDDSDEKGPMKEIQMKKIICINLFLEKTSCLISIHSEMSEMWGELFKRNIRNFCSSGFAINI